MNKSTGALIAFVCFMIAGVASFAAYVANRETIWLTLGVVFIVLGLVIYRRVQRH